MTKLTREEKLARFRELAEHEDISTGRQFAESSKVRLLIDHPHTYRAWDIVGKSDIPGFYHLESRAVHQRSESRTPKES
jgi:hypothetical protein